MDLYEAIEQMRETSRQGGSFSFSFMSYSEDSGKSDGIIDVPQARLRSRQSTDHNRNAEIMEAYTNLLTGEARQFYQPLIMIFNGQKVNLQ